MQMNAVIIYHANHERYPKKWIDDCLVSIQNQRVEEFEVLELDYGQNPEQLYEGSQFFTAKFKEVDKIHRGHSHAHNWLCRKAVELGFDYVFNTNIDDFYHYERLYRQVQYLKQGYDVVSSNMTQIDHENRVIMKGINMMQDIAFSEMNIVEHFNKGHNIIAHPACAYSANFIKKSGLLNPLEVPKDDFELWKRSINKFTFKIAPYTLLYYRIWGGNVSAKK